MLLIDAGVEVLFGDLPELNGAMGKFVLITMANVAELEAGLISERTKAALKAAKARGVRLGRHDAEILAPRYRQEARQRAEQLRPVITELQSRGLSLARIAAELNKRKVPTPRRGRWDHFIGAECDEPPSSSLIQRLARFFTPTLGECLLYHQERPCSALGEMSAKCQQRT